MRNRKKVVVGVKGSNPTTHDYITGEPLEDTPINYGIGPTDYISVNHRNRLSEDQYSQIKGELTSHLAPKKQKKEVS
jgi:hypothetical protein